jgi:hypothetical protein
MHLQLALALYALVSSPSGEIGALRGSLFLATPDFLGFSAALTAIPYVEIEGGKSVVWDTRLFAPPTTSWFVRAGPRLLLFDGRSSEGSGGTLRVAALLGYRSWSSREEGALGDFEQTSRALNAVAALEATAWLLPHLGLQAQIVVGGNLWLGDAPRSDTPPGLDAKLSLGVAF